MIALDRKENNRFMESELAQINIEKRNQGSSDSSVFEDLSNLPVVDQKSVLQNIVEISFSTDLIEVKKEKLTRSKSNE